jgi:hypothetical protein
VHGGRSPAADPGLQLSLVSARSSWNRVGASRALAAAPPLARPTGSDHQAMTSTPATQLAATTLGDVDGQASG